MKYYFYTFFICIFLMSQTINLVAVQKYAQTSQQKEIEQRELDRRIQESLLSVAFSKKFLERQSGMDFLLDHPQESYQDIKDLLSNEGIDDGHLMNIWNIFTYLQSENNKPALNCQEIGNILKIQKNKISFTSFILDQEYNQCSTLFLPIIKLWLQSNNNLQYKEAFILIKKYHIENLTPLIYHHILYSNDPLKQEYAFNTLGSLNTDKLDIKPLIRFLDAESVMVRSSAVRFFTEKPQYNNLLRAEFDQWFNSDAKKIAIIQSMENNKDNKTFDFMIEEYPNNDVYITEINNFFLYHKNSPDNFIQIINLFDEVKRTNTKISLLNLMIELLPQFIDKPLILETLNKKITILEQENNYAFNESIKKIKQMIFVFQTKKSEIQD